MSSSSNAGVFSYEEANIYPVDGPATFQTITYSAGTNQSVTSTNLTRFASQYTRVNSSDPMLVNLTNNSGSEGDLNMHAIIAYSNSSWTVYSGSSINVDPTGSSSVYLAVVSHDTCARSAADWQYQIDITDGDLAVDNDNMHAIIAYSNSSWTVYSGSSIKADPTGSSSVYLAVVSQDISANNWNYQIDITDGDLAVDNDIVPAFISVSQNYPNPFNPSTSFDIKIPHKQQIRIKIVSVSGKRIVEIVNRTFGAGNQTFRWDGLSESGSPVPSGQYLIVIEGYNFQRWLKATLLK